MTKSSLSPLVVGDLVCMFRRRSKGLGIVMHYCADIEECMKRNPEEVMESYREFAIKDWRRRDDFKKMICRDSCDSDLVFDFFLYNTAFKGKLKTKFAFVKWFKKPSTYSADAVYSLTGWFPAEWLRAY